MWLSELEERRHTHKITERDEQEKNERVKRRSTQGSKLHAGKSSDYKFSFKKVAVVAE